MKRLNFVFLGLVLLLATSCGNSFLSKSSAKTADITISLPLKALQSSTSARDAYENSNKLTVELYVNNKKQYETIITDFTKSEETITFPDIVVGSTVQAVATLFYGEQQYYGKSEKEIVTEEEVSLSITLKKVKQRNNQGNIGSFQAEPTEQGVKLTLSNLTRGDYLRISTKNQNDNWYERFNFMVGQSNYTIIDKYVNSGETITYEFTIEHNGTSVTSEPITVTTTGGSGKPSITAENSTNGIVLSLQCALPNTNIYIYRQETNSPNNETISLQKENINDVLNKTLTDYFVNSGKEYSYSVSTFIQDYGTQGVLYTPRSNIITITANSGLGDITITNVPEATYDDSSMQINFTTPPQAGISGSINDVSIGVEFIYRILPGSQNITVPFYFGDNSIDISWMAQDDDLKGKTLQLRTNTSQGQLYCGYAFDNTNRISYGIYHYEDNIDLSKMPKFIVIP